MAITHFKILSLPSEDYVTTTISGNPVQLNTLYPIAEQSNILFQKVMLLANLYVNQTMSWVAVNDEGIESNISYCTVIWKTILDFDGISDNGQSNISNGDVINLLDILDLNEASEEIVFDDYSGPGQFMIGEFPVSLGQEYLIQTLVNSRYTPEATGGGNPYFTFDFFVKRTEQKKEDITRKYKYIFIIDSIAELTSGDLNTINYNDEFDNGGTTETYNVIEEIQELNIGQSYANKNVNVEVIINSPFLSLNSFNKVIVESNDIQNSYIEKASNETFNLSLKADKFGAINFSITNYIVEDTADPKTGNITVNLIDVDGDTNLVSPTDNQVIITTNL